MTTILMQIADHSHKSVLMIDNFKQIPVHTENDKGCKVTKTVQPFAQGVASLPAEGKVLVGTFPIA